MGEPAFDYRGLIIAERLQLVEDIWDSIAEAIARPPFPFDWPPSKVSNGRHQTLRLAGA